MSTVDRSAVQNTRSGDGRDRQLDDSSTTTTATQL